MGEGEKTAENMGGVKGIEGLSAVGGVGVVTVGREAGTEGAEGAEGVKETVLRSVPHSLPQRLSLPNNSPIREVWAGSEYTVVSDNEGYLWGTGWNEHGNLARGPGCEFVSSDGWVKVMRLSGSSRGSSGDDGGRLINGSSSSNRNSTDLVLEHVQVTVEEAVSTDEVYEHVRLSVVWEGAVACGGGHVLCLTEC